MNSPYHTTIVLVGSKNGTQGYHVFRDGRLTFRMALTFEQQCSIQSDGLCGIDTRNPPETITVINPYSLDTLSTTVTTIDDAKTVLRSAFENQFNMFFGDH